MMEKTMEKTMEKINANKLACNNRFLLNVDDTTHI